LGFVFALAAEFAGESLFQMPPYALMWQGPGDFRAEDVRDKMPRWHQEFPP